MQLTATLTLTNTGAALLHRINTGIALFDYLIQPYLDRPLMA